MADYIPFVERDLLAITNDYLIKRMSPVVQESGMLDYLGGIIGQAIFTYCSEKQDRIHYWKLHDHCAEYGMFLELVEQHGTFTLSFYQTRGDMSEPWQLWIQATIADTDDEGYFLSVGKLLEALESHLTTLWTDAQWSIHKALYEGTSEYTDRSLILRQNRAPVVVGPEHKRYTASQAFVFAIDLCTEAMYLQLKLRD